MGRKPVDLYKLKKLVAGKGGAEIVSANKEWSSIGRYEYVLMFLVRLEVVIHMEAIYVKYIRN